MKHYAQRAPDNPWLRFSLALALANLPFWMLGQFHFMNRGAVNLDCILAIVVMPFSVAAGILLLCVIWLADLSLSLAMAFHFSTPLEFIRAIKFGSALQLRDFVTPANALSALPFLLCGYATARLCRRRQPRFTLAAVAITAVLALVDMVNGSSALSDKGTWKLPMNLAGSPLTTLASIQIHQPNGAPLRKIDRMETAEQLIDVVAWAQEHPNRSVLFVIVESLGAPQSTQLRAWLDRQLAPPASYELRTSDVPFRGSTTAGELRQLCALAGSYRGMSQALGSQCLPARLAATGWKTTGLHGFSRRMFDRQQWWPMIGLQDLHFIDSPLLANEKHCGAAFRGGCDSHTIAAAVQAARPARHFVYLLTLNTHLPLSAGPVPVDLAPLCEQAGANDEVCALTGALGKVLSDIRHEVDRSGFQPLVIVIGDHAPPFSRPESRQAFFADKVPAFALVPAEPPGDGRSPANAPSPDGQR